MTRKLRLIILVIFPLIVLVSKVGAEEMNVTSPQASTEATTKLKKQVQLINEQKNLIINKVNDKSIMQIQAARNEFNSRIQTIKDQRKKILVERIDTEIARINKNQTSKFSEALKRLQEFLDKISKSTTDPNLLVNISTAQSNIDVAKEAVSTQTLKTYTMTITDDATLRQNAEVTLSQFRQELTAVYKLVADAKQAVQNAHPEKSLIKKEATTSAGL